jgi:hypothetical protein
MADAVRALLQALEYRRVDLTRLAEDPNVRRVVAAMTACELTAEAWRQHADARYLAAMVRAAADVVVDLDPEAALHLCDAAGILRAVALCR